MKDELLEEQLGAEEYWEFVYRYLLSMSEPEERAKKYRRWERERREENPSTWEQQPATPFGPDDVPYHGPPCSDCCVIPRRLRRSGEDAAELSKKNVTVVGSGTASDAVDVLVGRPVVMPNWLCHTR